MPGTACLHIRARESDPIRVVDLAGGSIRIGRASFCDVRLPQTDLADEECRLRRRGSGWQIVPSDPRAGAVWLGGSRVDVPQAIDFDVPFQVGSNWLTLRPTDASTNPSDFPGPGPEVESLAASHRNEWQARTEQQSRWLDARRETKKWESRWRAAGEKLRSERTAAPIPTAPALDAAERSRRADFHRAAFVKRAETPAPASSSYVPVSSRPAAQAPVARRQPARNSSRVVPRQPVAPPRTTAPIEDLFATEPVPRESDWLSAEAAALAARVIEPEPPIVEAPPPPVQTVLPAAPSPEPSAAFDDEDEDERAAEAMTQSSLGATRRLGATRQVETPEPVVTLVEPPVVREAPTPEPRIEPTPRRRASARRAATPRPEVDAAGFHETPSDMAGATRANHGARPRPSASPSASTRRNRVSDDTRGPAGRTATEANRSRPATSARDWPSVSDIFAARVGGQSSGVNEANETASKAKTAPIRPLPTVVEEPGQWQVPVWLGWVPATAAALAVGIAGTAGAWVWAQDGFNAGVVARRLASGEPGKKPLPEGVTPGSGAWWRTSATHLVEWASFLDRNGDDPTQADDARGLLEKAANASPLNPTVRHAMARMLPGETITPSLALARSLGQSRDVLTFTWAGHQLLASGKKDAALAAYRQALEMAARTDQTNRAESPAFLEDTETRRYELPTEDQLAAIITDMAASPDWSFNDWSETLPKGTAAPLVAARVLLERASPDAGAALEAALPGQDAEAGVGKGDAVRLASEAAALAMKRRWTDARNRYTAAIDLMPAETVRRSWWLNVANISAKLNEETDRQKALELAKNADTKDEITQRAVDLQKSSGLVARRSAIKDDKVERVAGTRP